MITYEDDQGKNQAHVFEIPTDAEDAERERQLKAERLRMEKLRRKLKQI